MKAKKLLSAILAGAMVLSTMTFTAFADTAADDYEYVTISSAADFDAFAEAVNKQTTYQNYNASWNSKLYVSITDDIDMSECTFTTAIGSYGNGGGFSGTLDGRGHTLSNYTVSGNWNYGRALFRQASDITVKDITFDNFTSDAAGATDIKTRPAGIIFASVLGTNNVFDGVTITNSVLYGDSGLGTLMGYGSGAYDNSFVTNYTFNDCTVENCTIYSETERAAILGELGRDGDVILTVTNCNFNNNKLIANIEGNTTETDLEVWYNHAACAINDPTAGIFYTYEFVSTAIDAVKDGEVIVLAKDAELNDTEALKAEGVIFDLNGHTLTLPANYGTVDNEDGTETVVCTAAAKIGDVFYATLEEAVAAANEADVIVLKNDVEMTKAISKNVIVDLNDLTLTMNVPKNGENQSVIAANGYNVTLKNGNVDWNQNNGQMYVYGNLTLDDVVMDESDINGSVFYIGYTDTTLTVKNSTLNFDANNTGKIFEQNNNEQVYVIIENSVINVSNADKITQNANIQLTGNGTEVNASGVEFGLHNGKVEIKDGANLNVENAIYYGISATDVTVTNAQVEVTNAGKDGINLQGGTMTIDGASDVNVVGSVRYDLCLDLLNTAGEVVKATGAVTVKDEAVLSASKTNSTEATDRITTEGNGVLQLKTPTISVRFVEDTTNADALDNSVWNIVLSAADGQKINRLTAADLTFKFDGTSGNRTPLSYEIVKYGNVEVNNVNNSKHRYEFHFDGEKDADETNEDIIIGQVKFTGYGKFTFGIEENANATNAAQATKHNDNIVDTYLPTGDITKGEGKLVLNDEANDGVIESEIVIPTHELTIKIDFPNEVIENDWAYQDMTVTISGGDLKADEAINSEYGIKKFALGADEETTVVDAIATSMTNGDYVITQPLTENTTYTVTVEGAGYRTAKYTVTMTTAKTLNFWNNVKDAAFNVEELDDTSAKNVTFLAGDIVKDNNINIYDLSAVVSYFGVIDLSKDNNKEYAKYDLNRDGMIDSKDVAMVLVSWNK